MTKHYTHEDITEILNDLAAHTGEAFKDYARWKIEKEAPAIIRQLLEEYEALDVKRAYFENLARQQGKRIEQLEAELKADPLHRVPPFDWGPGGEPEGKSISYSVNGVKFDPREKG